jgi:lysyl-tRNA synthetase class 2
VVVDNIPRLRTIRRNLVVRAEIIKFIRLFFTSDGFLEVETPSLTPTPIPEANIEPVPSGIQYLGASPELHMKQLLGAGYGDIFQVCHSFRQAERGNLHNPEFTILEWYRVNSNYSALMDDCEKLLLGIAGHLGLLRTICYNGREIELATPWPRVTVRDAYLRWAAWDPVQYLDHNRFNMDMIDKIEPRLLGISPVFLVEYPSAMASLARLKPGQPSVAERFELYAGGLELANGFTELIDEAEQRARFLRENELRVSAGNRGLAMPESLLSALPFMPDCAGCALGVDRLVMLYCDALKIDDVMAFPAEYS